jgi:tripartite-type tricarboxylate transporter receptor subunit TctC
MQHDKPLGQMMFRLFPVFVILLSFFALHSPATAETKYSAKPVRIVLPFGAGGVADITARVVADKLSQKLGERLYVENQPGAGGISAARAVISAPSDGYTLALLSNGTAVSVSLFNKLPFDPVKDFAPISGLGTFDFIFATSADSEKHRPSPIGRSSGDVPDQRRSARRATGAQEILDASCGFAVAAIPAMDQAHRVRYRAG